MKKLLLLFAVVALGLASAFVVSASNADPIQYTQTGYVMPDEDWSAEYTAFETTAPVAVEAYSDYVILRGWSGVEGYDLKVSFDADENVTDLVAYAKGEESTVASNYCGTYTGLSDYYYAQFCIAEGYAYANSVVTTQSGYFTVLVTMYDANSEATDFYYNVVWETPALEDFSACADAAEWPEGTKVLFDFPIAVVYGGEAGFAVVTDGTNNVLFMLDGVTAGDEIQAGAIATFDPSNGAFVIANEEDLDISATGKYFEPTEIAVEDILSTRGDWAYVCLMGIDITEENIDEADNTVVIAGDAAFIMSNIYFMVDAPAAGNYNIIGFWMRNPGIAADAIDDSTIASFTFLPVEFISTKIVIDSFTALADMEAGTVFEVGCDLNVVYSNDGFVVVNDGASNAAIVLDGVEAGDLIEAGLICKLDDNGMLLVMAEPAVKAGEGKRIDAMETSGEDVYTTQAPWNYVAIMGVELSDEDVAELADDEVIVAYTGDCGFGMTTSVLPVEVPAAGKYNIVGFWQQGAGVSFGEDNVQATFTFLPVEFLPATITIDSFANLADFPAGTEFVVDADLNVVYSNDGFTVVNVNDTNAAITLDGVEAGDLIEAGLVCVLEDNGMLFAKNEPVVKAGEGKVIEAAEYAATDALSSQAAWNYVVLMGVELTEENVAELADDDQTIIEAGDAAFNMVSNYLPVEVPAAGKYNVVGFWMQGPSVAVNDDVKPTYAFLPVEFLPATITIDSFANLADFPAGTEFVVDADLNVVYSNDGFTVVNVNDTNAAITLDGVEAGDLIEAGLVCVLEDNGMLFAKNEPVVKAGEGKRIEVAEYPAAEALDSQAPWNYVVLMGVELTEENVAELADEDQTVIVAGDAAFNMVTNYLPVEVPAAGKYNVVGFWMQGPSVAVNEDVHATYAFLPVDFVPATITIDSFNALADIPADVEFVLGMDVDVVYSNDGFTVVTDGEANAAVVLDGVEAGDLVEAGLVVKKDENGVLTIMNEPVVKAGEGKLYPAKEYAAAEAYSSQAAWAYVVLMGVELTEDNVAELAEDVPAFIEAGEAMFSMWTTMIPVEVPAAGKYNVVGFWMQGESVAIEDEVQATYTFLPVEFLPGSITIDKFSALADIPEGVEFVVDCDLNVVWTNGDGFTVVNDGEGNAAMILDGVAAGDLIEAGLVGVLDDKGMIAVMNEPVVKAGEGKRIEAAEYAAVDAISSQAAWNYVALLGVELTEENLAELADNESTVVVVDEDNYFLMWNEVFNTELPEAGKYNVVGFWMQGESVANDEGVRASYAFLPIEFLPGSITIDSFNALSDIPEDVEFVIGMDIDVVYSEDGFTVATDGEANAALILDAAAGDLVEAGLIAKKDENGMLVVMNEPVIKAGEGKRVDAKEYAAEEALSSQASWAYVALLGVEITEQNAIDLCADEPTTIEAGDAAFTMVANILPVEIPEVGKYNVVGFWMQGAGVATEDGEQATYAFLPVEFLPGVIAIDSFAALYDLPVGQEFEVTIDLNVVYSEDGFTVLTDGDANAAAYLDGVAAGDLVKAGLVAKKDDNGLLMIMNEPVVKAGAGTVVEAKEYAAAEAYSSQADWAYVALLGVELTEENVADLAEEFPTVIYAGDAAFGMACNILPVEVPAAGVYNVVGFWMQGESVSFGEDQVQATYTFLPVEFLPGTITIDSFNALSDLPAGVRFVLDCDLDVVYSNDGFTVVSDGAANAAMILDGVAAGDLVKAGVIGMLADGIITVMNEDEVEVVAGAGKHIEAAEYDAAEAYSSQAAWAYVILKGVELDEENVAELADEYPTVIYAGEAAFTMAANVLPVEVPAAGKYNVVGFWMQGAGVATEDGEQATYTFLPVEFLPGVISVESLTALADMPEGQEFELACALNVIYAGDNGIAIVTDGESNAALLLDALKVEATDVLNAVVGALDENGIIYVLNEDNVEVKAGEGEKVEAALYEGDDVLSSQAAWAYVTVKPVLLTDANLAELAEGEATVAECGNVQIIVWNELFNAELPAESDYYQIEGFWYPGASVANDEGVKATYALAPVKIKENSGINGINADEDGVVYYNLNGVKVQNPAAGEVVIRVQGNKATKIVIR